MSKTRVEEVIIPFQVEGRCCCGTDTLRDASVSTPDTRRRAPMRLHCSASCQTCTPSSLPGTSDCVSRYRVPSRQTCTWACIISTASGWQERSSGRDLVYHGELSGLYSQDFLLDAADLHPF